MVAQATLIRDRLVAVGTPWGIDAPLGETWIGSSSRLDADAGAVDGSWVSRRSSVGSWPARRDFQPLTD